MWLETVRVSEPEKEQLLRLKRTTGIKNWNVLCRWALCASLAEPSSPAVSRNASDSSVEMTWKVFGGIDAEIFEALIKQRCFSDGLSLDDETYAQQFKLHLNRGIGILAGLASKDGLSVLVKFALSKRIPMPSEAEE